MAILYLDHEKSFNSEELSRLRQYIDSRNNGVIRGYYRLSDDGRTIRCDSDTLAKIAEILEQRRQKSNRFK